MHKWIVLMVAVLTALALALVGPVAAAPADKTIFETVECVEVFGPPEASWFTGKDDRNWHLRGGENQSLIYMWDEGGGFWDEIGANVVVTNFNAQWMLAGPAPAPTEGSFWGDFNLTTDFGDFAGSWAWGDWPSGSGHAAGKGINGDAGKLIKGTLTFEDPGWGDGDYPCPNPDFALLEVIDTKP